MYTGTAEIWIGINIANITWYAKWNNPYVILAHGKQLRSVFGSTDTVGVKQKSCYQWYCFNSISIVIKIINPLIGLVPDYEKLVIGM